MLDFKTNGSSFKKSINTYGTLPDEIYESNVCFKPL